MKDIATNQRKQHKAKRPHTSIAFIRTATIASALRFTVQNKDQPPFNINLIFIVAAILTRHLIATMTL